MLIDDEQCFVLLNAQELFVLSSVLSVWIWLYEANKVTNEEELRGYQDFEVDSKFQYKGLTLGAFFCMLL